jgi:hypothetical protein
MSLTPEERDALRDRLRQFRSGEPVTSPSEPTPAEPLEAPPPPPAPLASSVPDVPSAAASENLIKCRACEHPIARDCPSCGAENPWKSQAEIDKEKKGKKVLQGCLIGCLGVIGLLLLVVMIGAYSSMINFPSSSSRSSPDRKSTDSTECQAIAMGETGLLDGPLVDAAHERCMAARGYRKK